jgi:hypothetical protein
MNETKLFSEPWDKLSIHPWHYYLKKMRGKKILGPINLRHFQNFKPFIVKSPLRKAAIAHKFCRIALRFLIRTPELGKTAPIVKHLTRSTVILNWCTDPYSGSRNAKTATKKEKI